MIMTVPGVVLDAALPVVTTCLQTIHDRYEDTTVGNRLFYHGAPHTRDVITRTTLIGRAMGLDDHDLVLSQIAAAGHDIRQQWDIDRATVMTRLRKSRSGSNEAESAVEVIRIMHDSHYASGPMDAGIVIGSLTATIAVYCVVNRTVLQPFLFPDSCDIIRAVALSDLGSAGMDSSRFATEGFSMFAEQQYDIWVRITSARKASDIPQSLQKQHRDRLYAWLKDQPDFARGREQYFSRDLGTLSGSPEGNAIRDLFCDFDASIRAAEENFRAAYDMPYRELLRKVYPGAFPDDE